jgi:hypothetical protein
MNRSYTNVFEILVGSVLIGLGLLHLTSQYRSLLSLNERISLEIIDDKYLYQENNIPKMDRINSEELCATIMGYREYPIMIDDKLIKLDESDYETYLTYIKKGQYKKEYQYDESRHLIMILYFYLY